MKKSTKDKSKQKNKDKNIFVLLSNWENVDEYSEEEIEDLFDEYNIPEVSYIEKIDKPEELIFE
ncbi:MAG: hypothetical protein WAV89_13555 [Ignavibacteriaceae bacterium]